MYTPTETTFALCPAGPHIAICYQFVDLGTQDTPFGRKRTVSLRWELPDELMDDGRPFSVGRKFNWSMNKAANFRHVLEAWRGRPFSADELNGNNPFDVKNLLGKACMINVLHKTNGDNTYANVDTVMSLPKGSTVPQQTNPNVYFALAPDRFDIATLTKLHEKVQEQIVNSPEYKALMRGEVRSDDLDDLNDDVPF